MGLLLGIIFLIGVALAFITFAIPEWQRDLELKPVLDKIGCFSSYEKELNITREYTLLYNNHLYCPSEYLK